MLKHELQVALANGLPLSFILVLCSLSMGLACTGLFALAVRRCSGRLCFLGLSVMWLSLFLMCFAFIIRSAEVLH